MLAIPALLSLASTIQPAAVGQLMWITTLVTVALMWEEVPRRYLEFGLAKGYVPVLLGPWLQVPFWTARELAWWWIITVFGALLICLIRGSPFGRSFRQLFVTATGN